MAEGVTIKEDDDGQRLDRWLKKYYPGLPFGQMQKILRTGQVRVDGKRAKGDTRLQKGQVVRIPPQVQPPPAGEKRPLAKRDIDFIQSLVIYKDQHIVAINKPPGLAVQGGSKITRHVDGMLDGLKEGEERPRLVHRLDQDTSGVLILARTILATRALGEMFKGRDIRKYYWAILAPAPELDKGKIQTSLAKVGTAEGERMSSVDEDDEDGKNAVTYYSVLERAADELAFAAFWPRTGRTHQIRVHALDIGSPLLGDYKYSPSQPLLAQNPGLSGQLHLHARRIIMPHPITGERLDITAPLDAGMRKTFKFFGFNAEDKTDPFEELD